MFPPNAGARFEQHTGIGGEHIGSPLQVFFRHRMFRKHPMSFRNEFPYGRERELSVKPPNNLISCRGDQPVAPTLVCR